MQLDWTPLRAELAKWHKKGLTLPIWWRDDDAVKPSDQLEALLDLSDQSGVPVHLAVIPREATKALVQRVSDDPNVIVVAHGWAHKDHETGRDVKSEFGNTRSIANRSEEATEGLRRLRVLFGDQVSAMFVPPWNRVADDFLPVLPKLGYHSFSTCHPRSVPEPAPGLQQINTHIDPLYWKPARRLSNPDLIIDRAVNLLKQRRQGKADNTEPFGLLTHHLAHDDRVWEFCRQYWSELLEAPFEIFRSP